MNLNLQSKKKKVLWIVSVVLISMAMPSTVFADELKTATLQMKESTYYVYPHEGKEHASGLKTLYIMQYIVMAMVK